MVYELLRFKKVVEAGSISKASRLLFVSQPALSKSIKMIESYYGVSVLERHPSGVRPTAYGTILYRAAAQIECLLLGTEEEVAREKALREPMAGRIEVRIGCSAIWNDVLLPEVMKTIERVDSYAFHVASDTSEQLLDDLLSNGSYDFVLCRILEDEKYKPLTSVPLLKSRTAVFVNERNPILAAGPNKERLQELGWVKLKNLPLVSDADLTAAARSDFPENFFRSAATFEVEDLMAAVQFLRNDYAILLPLAFERLLAEHGVRPLPFANMPTTAYWLGMVHAPDREQSVRVRELMNSIRRYFARAAADTRAAAD